VQFVDERPGAADEIDPLRHAQKIEIGLRVGVRLRKVRGELGPARQVPVLVPAGIRRATEETGACAEERDDRARAQTSGDDLAVAPQVIDSGQFRTPGIN
jgi:hypothetical protein